MAEVIYKELSYKIVGLAYEVYNSLGFGLKEKIYADALEELFKQEGVNYQREVHFPLMIREKAFARQYFDFCIDEKIILELKVGGDKYLDVYRQILQYIKTSNLQLGIIIRFTKDGVKTKRLLNSF